MGLCSSKELCQYSCSGRGLPVQLCLLQGTLSNISPTQDFPPYRGVLHSRYLLFSPSPHVFEQGPQGLQMLHNPSTKITEKQIHCLMKLIVSYGTHCVLWNALCLMELIRSHGTHCVLWNSFCLMELIVSHGT